MSTNNDIKKTMYRAAMVAEIVDHRLTYTEITEQINRALYVADLAFDLANRKDYEVEARRRNDDD